MFIEFKEGTKYAAKDEDKNAELIAEQTVKNIMRYFI